VTYVIKIVYLFFHFIIRLFIAYIMTFLEMSLFGFQ